MKKIHTIILVFVLTSQFSYSQNSSLTGDKSELFRLDRIKDKIIIQEIKPLLYNYSWDTIKPDLITIQLTDTNEFYATFSGQGLDIMINCEYFYPPLHSMTSNYDSLRLINDLKEIDGKVFWGTDGTVPQTKVHKIRVKINGIEISIPMSATDGMYNPNFGCNKVDCYNFVYQSYDKKRIYIKMNNSDGAGFYQVVWIIKDGKYYDKVIDLGP